MTTSIEGTIAPPSYLAASRPHPWCVYPVGRLSSRGQHIGLNLIFLVPGETGGMEVVARELIPALLQAAPPDMRFTAFVNREAAADSGPWGELPPGVTVPVNARQRA